MGKPYSTDLRARVLANRDSGMKVCDLAKQFQVTERWIYQLLRQRRETGDIEPRYGKPGPRPKLTPHEDRLRALVKEQPDATLTELQSRLGVNVCLATIWNTLQDMGFTLKKAHSRGGAGSRRCA